jgi:hypothetical protein
LVIAWVGVWAVFALNTVGLLFFGLVVILWHPPAETVAPPAFPEPFGAALRAGGRYVRYAPVVRRILLRLGLFLVPATVLWALLPIVAAERLGQGAEGYGLLLGALGVGAIAGAVVLPRVRARLSDNALLGAASILYAACLVALVLVSNFAVILAVLLAAGIAWVVVLSNMNATLQLFLPAWVRARGLSIYQVVLFGSQAFGAVLWGLIAGPLGLVPAFLVAAGCMLAGAATIRFWPLSDTRGMDRNLAVYWAEPQLAIEPDEESGPVVVTNRYTIAPEKEHAFLHAMARVRQSRLRTGATQWGLFRDGEREHRFVELFVVPSWEEHLRQHRERLTGADRQYEDEANALSEPPPQVEHLIAANVKARYFRMKK